MPAHPTSYTRLLDAVKTKDYQAAQQTFSDIMQQKVAERLHLERSRLDIFEAYLLDKPKADAVAKKLLGRGYRAMVVRNRDGWYIEVIGQQHHYHCSPNQGPVWMVDVVDFDERYDAEYKTNVASTENDIDTIVDGLVSVLGEAMRKWF